MGDSLVIVNYSGAKAENGIMDARASAEALLGFDRMIRYAICNKEPKLKNVDFDLPVKVQKGTWEITIPQAITIVLTAYLVGLANQSAKEGFIEIGPIKDSKKLIIWAGKAIRWFIKITKHIRAIEEERYKLGPKTISCIQVEIINDDGESLIVPLEFYKFFTESPTDLLEKNANIIEEEREMTFAAHNEEPIGISFEERKIYVGEGAEEESDIVLPELKHGDEVELEGKIIRTNENTKTIGFCYQDHTLTVIPEDRNLEKYKSQIVSTGEKHIFSEKVKIFGRVEREDKEGNFKYKKPRIFFYSIRSIETKTQTLF